MSAVLSNQGCGSSSAPQSNDNGHQQNSENQPRPPPVERRSRANLRRQVVVATELLGPTPMELSGVLPVPPKRPAYLPARYEHYRQGGSVQSGSGAPPLPNRPNRYRWAQMQQWQAAAAMAAREQPESTLGSQVGVPGAQYLRSPFSSAASRVLEVNPMQIVNLSEHTKSSLIKFIEAVKKFSEKWFSHVLLLLFLAVYACFGAYVFISFEAPTEQWEKQQIIESRQKLVNDSWWDATEAKKSKLEYYETFKTRLEEYERLLNKACASGMTSSSLDNQWNFWGALFYSMTVFTTIGYGHLTPITFAGRVATMVYAIFGIPILLMVLADLGKLLTRIIKYTFKKFRYFYHKLMKRKESLRTRKMISDNTNQYIGVARGVFERGFATYIQPSYDRIPQALKMGSLRKRHRPETDLDQEAQQQQQAESIQKQTPKIISQDEVTEPGAKLNKQSYSNKSSKRHSETTDVIVTPGKQTKPVSPCTPGHCGHHHERNHHHAHVHNQHHHHQHHHHHHHHSGNSHSLGRGHSPGAQVGSKKKSSFSGSYGLIKRNQPAKSSVSRSSSRSSMLGLEKYKVNKAQSVFAGPQISGTKINSKDAKINESREVESSLDAKITRSNSADAEPEGTLRGRTGVSILDQPSKQPEEAQQSALDNGDHIASDLEYSMDEIEQCPTLEEVEELEDDFDIPVSFALFLLVTYMMLGAVVFSIWEGWNFFDSLYFVFISMSTIGFGDLVPQHPKRMIGTFAYLLFGLALTSMCINVVQEKIHATFLRAKMQIGGKMGFDLDQIMADDYYDGSIGGDCDPESGFPDDECCSQANSSTGLGQNGVCTSGERAAQNGSECDQGACEICDAADEALRLKTSKSRESLRGSRRRPAPTGLASHCSNTGSFKRRSSKRFSRQLTPTGSSEVGSKTSGLFGQQQMSCESVRNGSELQRTSTVEANVEPPTPAEEQTTSALASLRTISPKPGVQQKGPPSSTVLLGQRPRLATSMSQPVSVITKSASSDLASGLRPSGSDSSHSTPPKGSVEANKRLLPASRSGRRSEGSSRRPSVSQELNQLDNLIVALSRTPSERFGPLLGIPSSGRSSRSNSPANPQSSSYRRATSMTTRPAVGQRQSLGQKPAKSPLPAASKSGELSMGGQPLSAGKSPAKLTLDLLRAAESQAALDELETIKFSQV